MTIPSNTRRYVTNARAFALVLMLLVLIAAFHLILTCTSTKGALQLPARMESEHDKLQRTAFFLQAEQLSLANFLLTGDERETRQMDVTRMVLHGIHPDSSHRVQGLLDSENQWYQDIAQPLIARRRSVDAGHSTMAELQVRYLELSGQEWTERNSQFELLTGEAPGVSAQLLNRLTSSLAPRMYVAFAICAAGFLVAILALRQITRLEEALSEAR